MKKNRIAIKIGSNVLTRPDGTLDITRMSAIVDQVSELHRSGHEIIIISSGAVACGRSHLHDIDTSRLDNVSSRQLFSAIGQVRLLNRYYDLFSDRGLKVGQVLTMKENFSTRRHYLNQRNCMMVMLENGIIPIVNENDTVSITELMFTDNDELSGLVATMMDCDALIILSNIDGIFNGDPKLPQSQVIRTVAPERDLSDYILSQRSGFGRGGMVTKYNIARKVADEGIKVIIANGKRDNILIDLINHPDQTIATVFQPNASQTSGMKRWIAHSNGFTKGSITLNAPAVKAITGEKAASVLPVGIISVNGDFEKDDLINILNPEGHAIGIGRTSMSHTEAKSFMGQHDCRPIIHYDYLYID